MQFAINEFIEEQRKGHTAEAFHLRSRLLFWAKMTLPTWSSFSITDRRCRVSAWRSSRVPCQRG